MRDGPIHPVSPKLKGLLAEVCILWNAFHGHRCHFRFDLKVERIEKVSFGLKVSKQRTVGDASLFGDARSRRTQSLRHDDARSGGQDGAALVVALGPRHRMEYINKRLDSQLSFAQTTHALYVAEGAGAAASP